MKKILINGLLIELERKKIKNLYLKILPPDGKIHISAPLKMSDEEISRFVLSKLDWIAHQQTRLQNRVEYREPEYITGEEVPVWGRKYELLVEEEAFRNQVSLEDDRLILYTKKGCTIQQRKKLLDSWYRKALEQEIRPLLVQWESILGVKSDSWCIRDMKTRWGTCNIRSKKICLNLQLAKKPKKCLEYVVVHELVHLLEKSHNHVFKAYMDRFLPGWRSIKKELNELK